MLVLKPSKQHEGVGVFTTSPIRKGERLRLFTDLHFQLRQAAGWKRRFSVYDKVTACYLVPQDYHKMDIGWYINHSDMPNLTSNVSDVTAKCFIRAGQELTMNYELL